MNWKQGLFWLFTAAVLFYYLLLFGVFSWIDQEEAQLFIPRWWAIRDTLGQPGGPSAVWGRWLLQYYSRPMYAECIHTLLLLSCGWMIHRLLRTASDRGYTLLLALLPLGYLLKLTVQGDYPVDGTVSLVGMLLFLCFSVKLERARRIALYGIVSTLALFWIAGLLAVGYALLYTLLAACRYTTWPQRGAAALSLLPALLLVLFSDSLSVPVPLSAGWLPEEQQVAQRLSHAFMYRVWMLFILRIAGIYLIVYFLGRKVPAAGWMGKSLYAGSLFLLLWMGSRAWPDAWHVQRMRYNEYSFLAHFERWDRIIQLQQGQPIRNLAGLNYLNLALAHKGELAERMFAFDQRGPKGLCADWDRSFYMTRLLCDIHFEAGQLALSESYAMDGFTQARRHGSALLLKRLVQISLLRGERALAQKYLSLLATMPFYRDWAARYRVYVDHPEQMAHEPALRGKRFHPCESDSLSLSVAPATLWGGYQPSEYQTGWEYEGCYYLLDKDLPAFKRFLEASRWESDRPLPRHFQEAALLVSDKLGALLPFPLQQEVVRRFEAFKQAIRQQGLRGDLMALQRTYGDTYWFYYYFKILQEEKGEKR